MVKKGHRVTFPKEADAKLKDANRQLRADVKRLKKQITELNKNIKQYEEILAKNFEHVAEMMTGITVEEAIKLAKKKKDKKPLPDTKQLVRERFKNMFKGNKDEEV